MTKKQLKYLRKCAEYILDNQGEYENYTNWCDSEGIVEADWEGNAKKHIWAKAMVASYNKKQLQEFRIRDFNEKYLIEHGFIKPNSIKFIKSLKGNKHEKKN